MSNEVERGILAALALRPSLFELADVTAADFAPGRTREMFSLMAEQWESDRPADSEGIDLNRIADKLRGDCPGTFCAEIISGQVRVEPETFKRRVAEIRRCRRSEQIVTEALKLGEIHLKTGAFDKEGFAELSRLIVKQSANGGPQIDVLEVLRTGTELQKLDARIEYSIDKLLPAKSLTLFHGRGGIGKTWICLQLAAAVSEGVPVFGQASRLQPVVFINFENPLAIMVERVRRLDVRYVHFWDRSADPRPPKLDSPDYELYKKLPAGALLIFDSLRSGHDGDENSSRDMAIVMGRLKEFREAGFTVLVNHHSAKGNEKSYKGSTAISDLADHVLSFFKVRPSSFEEIEDDLGPAPGDLFYFGTREKTRYEPFKLFLSFQDGGSFILAGDPDVDKLAEIQAFIGSAGHGLTQTEVCAWAKAEFGIGKKGKIIALLTKGASAGRWRSRRDGYRRIYESL